MKNALVLVAILMLFGGCHPSNKKALPFYASAAFDPLWVAGDSQSLDTLHRIAPFSFTDQEGNALTENSVRGKIYVADFIFTRCGGICPMMTENMKLIQKAFANDGGVMLLSHSVTPQSDSVEVLARYAREHGINYAQWRLATGSKKEIYDLARTSYFADEDLGTQQDENDFLHTENFILVDAERRIRGVYGGTSQVDVLQLIEDIKALKAEG